MLSYMDDEDEVKDQIERFFSRAEGFQKASMLLGTVRPTTTDRFYYLITCVFLNAVCLELIIKMFWMIEKKKISPKNHNISKLFKNLSDEIKECIKGTFYNNESRKKGFEMSSKRIEQAGKGNLLEENFEKILINCEDIVKNLKYNESNFSHPLGGQHLDFLQNLLTELRSRIGRL